MELLLFCNCIGNSFIKYLQVISILKYTFDLALSKLTNNIKIEVSSMYIARTLNNRFFSSKKFILSSKIN